MGTYYRGSHFYFYAGLHKHIDRTLGDIHGACSCFASTIHAPWHCWPLRLRNKAREGVVRYHAHNSEYKKPMPAFWGSDSQ